MCGREHDRLQLMRQSLGRIELHLDAMTRKTLLAIGAALLLWGCERFWSLRVHAVVPAPIDQDCVSATLRRLFDADSVSAWPIGDPSGPGTSFMIWAPDGTRGFKGKLEPGADSVQLSMGTGWVTGWPSMREPDPDSVRIAGQRFAGTIAQVALSCWRMRVTPTISRSW